MIFVKLMGGMGNQMFQYAAGRRLAEKHKTTVKLDLSFLLDRTYRENFTYRDYVLDVFNISGSIASKDEIDNYIKGEYGEKHIIKEKHFCFNENIISAPDNSYLEGYWQSEKYFKDIEVIIKNEFSIKNIENHIVRNLADRIISSNSVCINVRRADFVNNPVASAYHGVCDNGYFKKAVDYIKEKLIDPQYYVFSDDIAWCIKELDIPFEKTVVGHEYAGNKFEYYLWLMMKCKHFIIPNSSFGWWAAWFSDNLDKIVIAPIKWFTERSLNTDDLIPPNWIRI